MHISRIFLFLCLLSLEAFLCALKFGFILLILTLHFCIFFAQFFLLFKKFLLFFLVQPALFQVPAVQYLELIRC